MSTEKIDGGVRIGHVHLKVSDLERSIAFYHGVLGFDITQRMGDSAAFLSAGGYHHHIGLNTWESKNGAPPPRSATGLFHVAILYPTRKQLADAVRRLASAGIVLDGAADGFDTIAERLSDPIQQSVQLFDFKRNDAAGFFEIVHNFRRKRKPETQSPC